MDYQVIISGPAIDDLEEIVRFIAEDNPVAAARFGGKLIASVRHLAQFPRFGRIVPEQTDEKIREIIFKSYRIFYRVNDETRVVQIARFWHAARGSPKIPSDLEC